MINFRLKTQHLQQKTARELSFSVLDKTAQYIPRGSNIDLKSKQDQVLLG